MQNIRKRGAAVLAITLILVLIINLIPSSCITAIAETISILEHGPVMGDGITYAGDYTPEAVPLPYLTKAFMNTPADELKNLLLPMQDNQSAKHWDHMFHNKGRKKTYPNFADDYGIDVKAYFAELTGVGVASSSNAVPKASASDAADDDWRPDEFLSTETILPETIPMAATPSDSQPQTDEPASPSDAPQKELEVVALDVTIQRGSTIDPYYGIFGNLSGYYVGLNLADECDRLDRNTPGDYTVNYVIIDRHNQVVEEISRIITVEKDKGGVTFQMEPDTVSVTPAWLVQDKDVIAAHLAEGVTAYDAEGKLLSVQVTDTKEIEHLLTAATEKQKSEIEKLIQNAQENDAGASVSDSREAYETYVTENSLAYINDSWYQVAYGIYPCILSAAYEREGLESVWTAVRYVRVTDSLLIRMVSAPTSVTVNETTGDDTTGNPYKTIDEAIKAVAAGGTVNIEGTVHDSIDHLIPKTLTIKGIGADARIIKESSGGAALFSNLNSGCVITYEDLTIDANQKGGCVFSGQPSAPGNTSNAIFHHVTLENATLSAFRTYNSKATFTDCTIRNNTCPGGTVRDNNGALCLIGSRTNVTISNTAITGNTAPKGALAAGVYAHSGVLTIDDTSVVKNNTIDNKPSNIVILGAQTKLSATGAISGELWLHLQNPSNAGIVIADSNIAIDSSMLSRFHSDDGTYVFLVPAQNPNTIVLSTDKEIKLDEIHGDDNTGIPAYKTIRKAYEMVPVDGTIRVYGTVHVDTEQTIVKNVTFIGDGDDALLLAVPNSAMATFFQISGVYKLNLENLALNGADKVSGVKAISAASDTVSAALTNVKISSTFAPTGGALSANGANIELNNCEITNSNGGNAGGAIYLISGGSAVIHDTTITGNKARLYGGGICVRADSSLIIDDKTIVKDNVKNNGSTSNIHIYSGGNVTLLQTGAPKADLGFTVQSPKAGVAVINDSTTSISDGLQNMLHSDNTAYGVIRDPNNPRRAILADTMPITYRYELPPGLLGAPEDCRPGIFGNEAQTPHVVSAVKDSFTPLWLSKAIFDSMPADTKKALDGWYLKDWYQSDGSNASMFTDFDKYVGSGYDLYAAWYRLSGPSVNWNIKEQKQIEDPQSLSYKTTPVEKVLEFTFQLPQPPKTADTVAFCSAYIDHNPYADEVWLYGKAGGGTYDLGPDYGNIPAGAIEVVVKGNTGSIVLHTLPDEEYYLHSMVVYTRNDGSSPYTAYPAAATTKLDLKSADLSGMPTPDYQDKKTAWKLDLLDDNVKQVAWSIYDVNAADAPTSLKQNILNPSGFITSNDTMLWMAEDFSAAQKNPTAKITLTSAQLQSLTAGTFYVYIKDDKGNNSMLSVSTAGKILNLKVTSKLSLEMITGADANNIIGDNQVDIVNHSTFPVEVKAVGTETTGSMKLVKDSEVDADSANLSLLLHPVCRGDKTYPFTGTYELAELSTILPSLGTLAAETGSPALQNNKSSFYLTGRCNKAMPLDTIGQIKIHYRITPVIP